MGSADAGSAAAMDDRQQSRYASSLW